MTADLQDRGDVTRLITEFYERAFADDLLGPVFVDIVRMDLQAHLPVMCDFWETVLFRAGTYRGNAFTVHVHLHQRPELGDAGLTAEMFARWLALWSATVDDLYAGPVAERAKIQAARIAHSIHRRLHARSDRRPMTIDPSRSVRQAFDRGAATPLVTSLRAQPAGTKGDRSLD